MLVWIPTQPHTKFFWAQRIYLSSKQLIFRIKEKPLHDSLYVLNLSLNLLWKIAKSLNRWSPQIISIWTHIYSLHGCFFFNLFIYSSNTQYRTLHGCYHTSLNFFVSISNDMTLIRYVSVQISPTTGRFQLVHTHIATIPAPHHIIIKHSDRNIPIRNSWLNSFVCNFHITYYFFMVRLLLSISISHSLPLIWEVYCWGLNKIRSLKKATNNIYGSSIHCLPRMPLKFTNTCSYSTFIHLSFDDLYLYLLNFLAIRFHKQSFELVYLALWWILHSGTVHIYIYIWINKKELPHLLLFLHLLSHSPCPSYRPSINFVMSIDAANNCW